MSKLKLPKIIGHRGAMAYAPENTLASIHTAADMGVEFVNIDCKLTKDHLPVIFHDEELSRLTNMSGRLDATNYDVIKELDAGSWFSESFMGEKVPSLEEAVEVIINRNLGLNLELRPCPGREIETATVALDLLSRFWDEEDDNLPLISSFSHVTLETAMDFIPAFPRGLLLREYDENWKDAADYLQISAIIINAEKTTQEQFDEYLDYRKPIIAYTVNDAERARELFDMGVASIFTDCPDVILEELESFN